MRGSIMYVLNFWHSVSDYSEWKRVFDSDPLGREASGVRGYSIERPPDDEHMVIGHLEFDTLGEVETFASRLEEVWKGSAGQIVSDTGYTVTEVLEQRRYGQESARRAA
jgi:hypothetical protein